jgi:hypothetical protein
MDNLELKQEWKKFTHYDYDLHLTIDLRMKPFESMRVTKEFLNHLHRKYPSQVFKSLNFIIDHGNTRIHNSHVHCLLICNPNYSKLYELIDIAVHKGNIFLALESKFQAWKNKRKFPKASIKVSCSRKVLDDLGIKKYKDYCVGCTTKKRDREIVEKLKTNLEDPNSRKLEVVKDLCKNCKRRKNGRGWTSKKIIKYIFEKHNFNVYDDHLIHNHLIDYYKWHLDF